ncbi:helix-turn-helix transcriptional regulator [Pseudonocardia humida]|uniref:Response regulator transcription factor n=1 Tax=Pseudonocardia humida TaxID=2800819 RepID=A0ABT1A7J7_9PSEU|nr:helix-turn-helix transcriptional regulator [Pseudonocardia humida]MCO1658988.1 response regulator transcription factor [Pseudonocardia humida]
MATGSVERGRLAFGQRAWAAAFAELSGADRESPLDPEDLEHLATAAYLVGRPDTGAEVLARVHREFVRRGDRVRAARCAFWSAFHALQSGEAGRAGGWLARARRLLDEGRHDCVERGYLLYPVAMQAIFAGDTATACEVFGRAVEVGDRFGEPDLVALARVGQGRALIRRGEPTAGMALLDEAMIAVTGDEVSPIVAGDSYCTVIEGCQETFDLRRAQEWTAALAHWCDSQPDLVLYRGQCLVHRAEIMQLHGAWPDAADEAQRACERFRTGNRGTGPEHPGIGAAFYQRAEVARLRGEFAAAEELYQQANRAGREPQPGLALLRLAQGGTDAARVSIARCLGEAEDRVGRARLLPAHVEIMLVAGDVRAARTGADELALITADLDAPLLRAASAQATGAVLLGEGDARAALAPLRRGWSLWYELGAPYEAARSRVLLGLACRALGDEDGAAMEFDAAGSTFQQLGAAPDLARVESLARRRPEGSVSPLTARELDVLRLVATGMGNRAIAAELFLSEKTVARHLSNIFTKLDLPSRSAATAYAYEHHLV